MSSAVYVLGMGRSGTSAVARLINLLGLPLARADDLLQANDVNPRGFWESASLTMMNDRVLAALGGSWSAPPAFAPGWENDERLAGLEREARHLFARLVLTEQWVWKDPRTSLTFPFWRRALAARPVLVLVYRHPLEVVRSLERGGLGVKSLPAALPQPANPMVSLALWERYNRVALEVAAGHPTFVVRYERLVAGPETTAAHLATFLSAQGLRLDHGARPAAGASIDPVLHRSGGAETSPGPELSAPQEELLNALITLEGPHDTFPPTNLPGETSWVEPLFVERRRVLALERERDSVRRTLGESPWAAVGVDVRLRWGRAARRLRAVAPHLRSRSA